MRILYLTASPQVVRPTLSEFVPQTDAFEDEDDPARVRKYQKLDLWPELSCVTQVLFEARSEGRVHLEVVPEVRRADLMRYLGDREISILHFSGHGERDDSPPSDDEWGSALLLKDRSMIGDYVPNEWLLQQLQGKGIKVIVLNCCWSDGLARKLAQVADCVVGTTLPLRSDAAANFSQYFYDALQQGMTLGEIKAHLPELAGISDTTYQFRTERPEVLDEIVEPIAVAERDLTPARQVLVRYQELKDFRDNLWSVIQADVFKVVFGLVVAAIGFFLISALVTHPAPETADASPATAELAVSEMAPTPLVDLELDPAQPENTPGNDKRFVCPAEGQKAPDWATAFVCGWGPYEPLAIVAALSGMSWGRILGYIRVWWGSPAVLYLLKRLALLSPRRIENELRRGRVAELLTWIFGSGAKS